MERCSMRLGWSKKGNSISYYVQQTIYVNGKNKSQVIKRLGSEKYICKTYFQYSKYRKKIININHQNT